MRASVLVAAPAVVARRFGEALGERFTVMTSIDRARAAVLVEVGFFQAIATVPGFLPDEVEDAVRVDPSIDAGRLLDEITLAVERRRRMDRRGAAGLVTAGTLKYDEYIELVRFRATRRYLLGLMHQHRGSVTEASRSAGIVRESLHRLLRRHDIDAEAFREP